MSNGKVEEAVINSLREIGCDADVILPVHDLQGDLGVDSTEMIELAALVRSRVGLYTQRLDLDEIRTVADLQRQLARLLETAAAAEQGAAAV